VATVAQVDIDLASDVTAYDYDDNYEYVDGDAGIGERKRNPNKKKNQKYTTKPPTTTTTEPTTTTIPTILSTVTDYDNGGNNGGGNQYAMSNGNQNNGNTQSAVAGYATAGGNAADGNTGAPRLKCFTCRALSVEACQAAGSIVECEENEDSCELEVRTRLNSATGYYDQIGIITGCKQKLACQNNQKQNFVGKDKDTTQCRPETDKGYDHSVCRQCCWDNDCVDNNGNFWDPQTRWQWKQENGRYGIN